MITGLIVGILYLFGDLFYWAKYAASLLALYVRKKTQKSRFDLYDYEVENQPEKLGVVVPEEEKIYESPFPEEHLQNDADEIFIYGVNMKSEVVMLRISRACNDVAEAWIYVKLSDGRWYDLEQTSGFQRNFSDKCTSFTCGGLQMYYLEPMRRWRIVYCGMLRERNNPKNPENKSVFVKFTFVWTASSEVYDASSDLDIRATADGLAQATWKSPFPPVHKVSEALTFYNQSGTMTGIVSIEDEPDKEIYVFGEKHRSLGSGDHSAGCNFAHILGVVPENGLVLHLGKLTLENAFKNLYFGFIVNPNSLIYSVEGGDITIRDNLPGNAADDKKFTMMFKAGRQYDMLVNLRKTGLHLKSEQGWGGHVELSEMEFEVDGCKGSGFMLSGQISKLPERKLRSQSIPPPLSFQKPRPLTVYIEDDVSHSTDLTGGKGSSLGKLTKLSKKMKSEFTVPKGLVVTTEAYEHFLTSELLEKIENLKNIAYGNTKGNLHETCKIAYKIFMDRNSHALQLRRVVELRVTVGCRYPPQEKQLVASAVEGARLPNKIAKEIEEKLNRLFDGDINNHKVAVRSSATGEDTDTMSAAGQMDTFLGVQGLKEIFTAVKKCWASQFGHIAIEYKKQNGQILNSPMAVVIQEMVQCEAAGVLFTCDPVTNNPSVITISGNYGLGESVVSGSEEPDTVVLQKLPNDEVKVKNIAVGMKQRRIVMSDTKAAEGEEGVVTEEVSEEEKNKCCIPEEMALKLGKLSVKIENYFKSPRDIEWGIKNNRIYMLQSRPITTGGAISDYEIKHEFDAPLRCENEFFSMCNVGEVLPGATSPLGLDVVNKYFSLMFQKKSMRLKQRNNFQQAKYFPTGIIPFYNHIMITVADLLTRTDDCDSLASQSFMIGFFGRLIDDPELAEIVKHRKYAPLKKTGYYRTFLTNLFFSGRGIEALKKELFKFKYPDEKGKTPKEVLDFITQTCSLFVEPFAQHITCTEMSQLWNMFMFSVIGKAKGSIDNEVYSDFAKLLASSSNVESADVPAAMQDLSYSIVQDIKSDVFRAMSVEEAQKWLETSTSTAGIKYRQFIKRHGHRCLKEFDVHSMPWNSDPKPLIKILQSMSGSCEEVKEKKEASLSDILPHLNVKLGLKSRLLLKIILPNCRRGVREREACKSNLIKAIDNIRKGFQLLSKVMVAEGYLPDMELIYFLTIDEIKDLLETRNPRHLARANHRRKLFPALDALLFPEISKGRPVPINDKQDDEEIEYVADLTMKGIPVSQGYVKGYARVALSLEEAAHLKRGEILITYSTDIGWSPYFPILAGVVTELGGLVSHGAVVSREYGLPCVVGLHGATRQFRTGDYVLLDGNKGLLQRLSPPEN